MIARFAVHIKHVIDSACMYISEHVLMYVWVLLDFDSQGHSLLENDGKGTCCYIMWLVSVQREEDY